MPRKPPAKKKTARKKNKPDPDTKFMLEALKEAKKAFRKGEVPVGAVIVQAGKVIARGYNLVEQKQSVVSHAEVVALSAASRKLSNWRLTGCTLYCTVEPCAMCKGAMVMTRLERLVYGAPNLSMAGTLQKYGRGIDLAGKIEVKPGVLEDECSRLMRDFFKQERERRKVEEN